MIKTAEAFKDRFLESRTTYKLNIGYAALIKLPDGFTGLINKYNPYITELELSSNNFEDLIEDFSGFRYLNTVRVKYNKLKFIPSSLLALEQLKILELCGNQISHLSDSIKSYSKLQELDLSGNIIKILPEAICSLKSLKVLYLENNQLESLPDNFESLGSLIKLNVSMNQLKALPKSMGQLRKIQRINCSNNRLSKVPTEMGSLKTLREFNLRYNNMEGLYAKKMEEGFSKFLLFLREEDERERLEEIERLKPIGTKVNSYMEYHCKADANQIIKNTNGSRIYVDNRCWIRSGHTFTQVEKTFYIFGGAMIKDDILTNDLFWISADQMNWHKQVTTGEAPVPRSGHCCVYDSEDNRLIIFGGKKNNEKNLNDIYSINLSTFKWSKIVTNGAPPCPRKNASATYWAGHMVIFGGKSSNARLNDLFLLDLQSFCWSQPAASGTAPSPRVSAAICLCHSSKLLVHGGMNNFVLDDLFQLDLMSKAWSEVVTGGIVPFPRHSHTMYHHKDTLYLFGGKDELGADTHNLYQLPFAYNDDICLLHPEWIEYETELDYNKSRTCIINKNTLSMIQMGSPSLGKYLDSEVDSGIVIWNVFKNVNLKDLNPKPKIDPNVKQPNPKRLRVHHTMSIASKLPKSHTKLSVQEEKVQKHLEIFEKYFKLYYPYRRQLYLNPKNECGIQKFVCLSLRPTKMPHTELYGISGIAKFVSEFFKYEHLENPLHPPEFLASPHSVIGWQAGDSFDIALVTVSLLLGVGWKLN